MKYFSVTEVDQLHDVNNINPATRFHADPHILEKSKLVIRNEKAKYTHTHTHIHIYIYIYLYPTYCSNMHSNS